MSCDFIDYYYNSHNILNNIIKNYSSLDNLKFNIFDVPNQKTACNSDTKEYIKNNYLKNVNDIYIFVMNSETRREIIVNLDPAIEEIHYKKIKEIYYNKINNNLYYVFCPSSIECDDKFIICFSLLLNSYGIEKKNITVFTEDNYDKKTKPDEFTIEYGSPRYPESILNYEDHEEMFKHASQIYNFSEFENVRNKINKINKLTINPNLNHFDLNKKWKDYVNVTTCIPSNKKKNQIASQDPTYKWFDYKPYPFYQTEPPYQPILTLPIKKYSYYDPDAFYPELVKLSQMTSRGQSPSSTRATSPTLSQESRQKIVIRSPDHKIIDIESLARPSMPPVDSPNSEQHGKKARTENYLIKYLKYKQKYIELKNKLK